MGEMLARVHIPPAVPIKFAEDIEFDPLAIHEIVKDVFGARRMSVTYGECNFGKTTLMLDLAFRMPSGVRDALS